MLHRRARNRNRSKRRSIYCPIHRCYLDSVSQRYSLHTAKTEQLKQRGKSRRNALTQITNQTAAPLDSEWIEAFWCEHCQETKWYHVRETGNRTYEISIVLPESWQCVTEAIQKEPFHRRIYPLTCLNMWLRRYQSLLIHDINARFRAQQITTRPSFLLQI